MTGRVTNMRTGGDPTTTLGDNTLHLMMWNGNSLSKYSTQIQFINKFKNATENCFILCDVRLCSDSENDF